MPPKYYNPSSEAPRRNHDSKSAKRQIKQTIDAIYKKEIDREIDEARASSGKYRTNTIDDRI